MEDNSLELNSDSSDLHVCSRQQSTSRFQPHWQSVYCSITSLLPFCTLQLCSTWRGKSEKSKSTTLPHAVASIIGVLGKDSFTQTLANGTTQHQAAETELSEASQDAPRAHFGLPESVTARVTLTNIVVSRHSMLAMASLWIWKPLATASSGLVCVTRGQTCS